jgi:predicted HAD superfamily Cof-like phosphohydrolase
MGMNQMQDKVKRFHDTYGLDDPAGPTMPPVEVQNLRVRLILEEAYEFREAGEGCDLPHAIKELCDLLYVVLGTANAYGIDIEPFFAEVHRSNMTKVWPDGAVHKDANGKVIKPHTYSPADIAGVLASLGGHAAVKSPESA